MPRKSKAQKPELKVPKVEDGDWTPGSFGWYIHQANVIASLNCEQNSLGAIYLAKVVERAKGLGKTKAPQRKKRYQHFAIISQYPEIGQMGCTTASSLAEATTDIHQEEPGAILKRIAKKDCRVCKEFGS